MKPFMARCIQYVTLFLMVVLCMVGASGPNYVVIGIGMIIGVVGAVVWVIFGRCSKCGGFLGRYMSKHCPHCGEKIE